MTIEQAIVIGSLYFAIIVGGVLEFRARHQVRNDADDQGADWGGEHLHDGGVITNSGDRDNA